MVFHHERLNTIHQEVPFLHKGHFFFSKIHTTLFYTKNMKLFHTFILAFVAIAAQAEPIDTVHALRIAQRVFRQVQPLSQASAQMSSTAPTYYIFTPTTGAGFVIVSGDDSMSPVLAYSEHATARSEADIPTTLQLYLDAYKTHVNEVRASGIHSKQYHANGVSKGTPVVEPLLTCTWNQTSPYITLCPQNSAVGCVATAMSQIMYYWKWPLQGKRSMSYTTGSGIDLYVDFSESTYNWDDATDVLNSSSPQEAKDVIAKISYDCGVATKMEYGTDGSGTHSDLAKKAFYTYFGYKASGVDLRYRDCVNTPEEWFSIIKTELDAGRPVFCAGNDGSTTGHAFVLDGYDTEGFLHVNWGAGGDYDGYYSPEVLDPGPYVFSFDQRIIYGMEPDRDGKDITPKQTRIYAECPPYIRKSSVKKTAQFSISVDSIWNKTSEMKNFDIAIVLCDLNGEILEVVSRSTDRLNLPPWTGYPEYGTLNCRLREAHDDGNYMLRLMFKELGYNDWVLPDMVGGDSRNIIPAYLEGDNLYFNQYSAGIEAPAETATVMAHDYYDLSGRQVQKPTTGIVIDHQTLSNGKKVVKKVRF